MSREEVDPQVKQGERIVEASLRPRLLGEFIGQESICTNLDVFLTAARQRNEPLDHLLLYGPPGLGKTTLAHIVGQEMGAVMHTTSGPAIERPGDLVGVLTNLEHGAVLFIDEIHRLSRQVEEILYPAMEDRKVDVMIGDGPAARSIRLDIEPFTVIGATTRQGLLTGPLRDRFGIVFNFTFYDRPALLQIVQRSAGILEFRVDPDAANEIAGRSRGTPRIANRLLRRVRDFAQVDGEETITMASVERALGSLGVDETGLDELDRRVLEAIVKKYGGGPVGVETLAATTGEDVGTIEDVCEPFLLQLGLIARTPRGRVATEKAFQHLGADYPKSGGLFST